MSKLLPSYLDESSSVEPKSILQKYNITSSREVEFFQQLCQSRHAIIPYKEALAVTNSTDEPSIFNSLLTKFQEVQVMILRTTITDGALRPTYIRLCDASSQIFYAEYVAELMNIAYVNPDTHTPPPTYEEITSQGIDLPNNILIPVNSEHFLDAYSKTETKVEDLTETDEMSIYSLEITNKQHFVCAKSNLAMAIDFAIKRLQLLFEADNTISLLTNILELPTNDIREKIALKDYNVWDNVVTSLYDNMSTLSSNQNVSDEIMDYIIILFKSIKPKLQFLKTQERISQLTDTFMVNVMTTIQQYDQGLTDSQLKTILQKEAVAQQFNDIQSQEAINDFSEKYIISNDNATAGVSLKDKDVVLKVSNLFIHSNNLIKIISENFFPLSIKLREYYVHELYKYLLNKLTPAQIVFFSEDDFETSVHTKVREFDELYSNILRNPVFLASILSHSGKSTVVNQFNSMSTTQKLALFYNLRTKKLLPWYEIFNLQLSLLIEEAYEKLSFVRKLVLIFTGRYKAMQNKITKIQNINPMVRDETMDVINNPSKQAQAILEKHGNKNKHKKQRPNVEPRTTSVIAAPAKTKLASSIKSRSKSK